MKILEYKKYVLIKKGVYKIPNGLVLHFAEDSVFVLKDDNVLDIKHGKASWTDAFTGINFPQPVYHISATYLDDLDWKYYKDAPP